MQSDESTAPELVDMKKKTRPRVDAAHQDLLQHQHYVNEVYAYGLPERRLMGEERYQKNTNTRQQAVMDSELQFALRECAAELSQIYTPTDKDWVRLEPDQALEPRIRDNPQYQQALQTEQAKLFGAIRRTRMSAALQTSWEDWLVSAAGIQIMPGRTGMPHRVQSIPLTELLIEHNSELESGIDGRWWATRIRRNQLKMRLPMVDWDEALRRRKRASSPLKGMDMESVTYGYHFDEDEWPNEVWNFCVFLDDDLVYHARVRGPGSCGIIAFRSGLNAPSAYPRGPANIALSPARTLDQLAYLNLKVLPKRVDPPFWYMGGQGFNPEQAQNAGKASQVGPEFQMGVFESGHGLDDIYTTAEILRLHVRRALWQDKPPPHEPGTTPPTAFQVQNQELDRSIRQERPRNQVAHELVIPVVQRFIKLESDRGVMAPITLQGSDTPINLRPMSPMSRSADLEEYQQGTMLLGTVSQLGDQGLGAVDMPGTISGLRAKLGGGAHLVKVKSPEQMAQERAQAAAAENAGAVAGQAMGANVAGQV